jgi:Zn-dependent metalloprotease
MNQMIKGLMGVVRVLCLLWAAAIFTAPHSLASVKWFAEGQQPQLLNDQVNLPGFSSLKINKALAGQGVIQYVNSQLQGMRFGSQSSDQLLLKSVHHSNDRLSFRFVQRFNRVRIEGAELVALVDSNGQLVTINSALRNLAGQHFTVQNSISEKDAQNAAALALRYVSPEFARDSADGLVIVFDGQDRPVLVWQLSVRESDTGDRPARVQIFAQGRSAGQVYKAVSLGHGAVPISIYDSSVTLVIPNPILKGVKVLENGRPTLLGYALISDEAKAAGDSIEKVTSYYNEAFGRNSYDNLGSEVRASVNVQKYGFFDVLGQKQNAAWIGPWKMFVFGAGGDLLGGFTKALDVVGHEYTHAVISSTCDLVYEKQPGALNEHLADVFGAAIQSRYEADSEFHLLGEGTLRGEFLEKAKALRDMLTPQKGLMPQPGSVREIPEEFGSDCFPSQGNDACGVHFLSGIPNRVTALAEQEWGYQKIQKLYYGVMTQRLRSGSNFADYRLQVLDECHEQFGKDECTVFHRAFEVVGIN